MPATFPHWAFKFVVYYYLCASEFQFKVMTPRRMRFTSTPHRARKRKSGSPTFPERSWTRCARPTQMLTDTRTREISKTDEACRTKTKSGIRQITWLNYAWSPINVEKWKCFPDILFLLSSASYLILLFFTLFKNRI